MTRTERLLDLIASLLDAQEPVPWGEIRGWFPDDYGAPKKEAGLCTFERDKATLLDLGVPLDWREPDEDGDGGHVVDKRRFYLPPIDLTREEAPPPSRASRSRYMAVERCEIGIPAVAARACTCATIKRSIASPTPPRRLPANSRA